MNSEDRLDLAVLDQENRLEIVYLDQSGQAVPRGRAIAVRRRVLDSQGHVLKERVREVVRRRIS